MTIRKPINILVSYIKQPDVNGFRALYQHYLDTYPSDDIGFEQCHISDVFTTAQNMVAEGCKILLCTGTTADYLQKKLEIDIFTIRPEGFDVIEAISSLKQIRRVAILSSDLHIQFDADIFAGDIKQFSYDSYLSAKKNIQQIKQEGFQAVIGSPVAVELAWIAGLEARLAIGVESLSIVLQQAHYRLEKIRQSQKEHQSLLSIFNHLQEGVCLVSTQGKIRFYNQALLKICHLESNDLQGMNIQSLWSDFDFARVKKQIQFMQFIHYDKKRLAVQVSQLEHEDYLVSVQEVSHIERTTREFRKSIPQYQTRYQFNDILTQDPQFLHTLELAKAYAQNHLTILITGESGTGKEMLAQSIHATSPRQHYPFVAINCASFPETLLESELFGYEDGAFTGARKTGKAGLIEIAHQGTLFLDEIGDMPVHLQTRLLRVLQEKQVQRLGATISQKIDIRIIAATHQDLEQLVERGQFRADLYYRLNILRLNLPALRARVSDIALLAQQYLKLHQFTWNDLPIWLRQQLLSYTWYGNIRELENMLERLAVLAQLMPLTQQNLTPHLPEIFAQQVSDKIKEAGLKTLNQQQEQEYIRQTIAACEGNLVKAAEQLQISRTTLWRKLKTK